MALLELNPTNGFGWKYGKHYTTKSSMGVKEKIDLSAVRRIRLGAQSEARALVESHCLFQRGRSRMSFRGSKTLITPYIYT